MGTKGYKSTEFWLSVVASVVGFLMASGAFPVNSFGAQALGLAAAVLTTLGYSVNRSIVKKAKMRADLDAAKLAGGINPSQG